MRPPIAVGEVFASVVLNPDGTAGWQLMLATATCAAGRPVVMARRLQRGGASGSEEPRPEGNAETSTGPVVVTFVIEDPSAPATAILSATAIAFLGKRGSGLLAASNDVGALQGMRIPVLEEESDVMDRAASDGCVSTSLSTVSQNPIGATFDVATILNAERARHAPKQQRSSGPAEHGGGASVQLARQRLQRSSQTGTQIVSLIKKDLRLARTSKCALCCGEVCVPLLFTVLVMLAVAGLAGTLGQGVSGLSDTLPRDALTIVRPNVYNAPGNSQDPLPFACGYNPGTSGVTASAMAANPLLNQSCSRVTSSASAFIGGVDPFHAAAYFAPTSGALEGSAYTLQHSVGSSRESVNPALTSAAVALLFGPQLVLGQRPVSYFSQPEGAWNARAGTAMVCSLYLIAALIPSFVRSAAALVDEKREGFREHLRVMGCGDFAYLFAAFGSQTLRTAPLVVLLTVILRILWWKDLDSFLIYVTLQLTVLATTGMTLMMPVFFESSPWATAFMILFGFGSVVCSPMVTTGPDGVEVLYALLLPPAAGWYTLSQVLDRNSLELALPLGGGIAVLCVQTIVFALLSQYVYRLFPGQRGVPIHPLAPCTRAGGTSGAAVQGGGGASRTHAMEPGNVIQLRRLMKYFGDQRQQAAVNLDLDVKQGEILALLGHNGAGKTTTVAMLAGLLEATEYEQALVAGLDIGYEMHTIRLNIGLCPQHDVLFGSLSARDHLNLFASLRGVELTSARCDEVLMFLDLPLNDQAVQEFSGGMKRRVSVASAVIASPAVVFLDEPTTGLDEVSRMKIWELLKLERSKGMTMILTTHSMEEAEALGDRIAIMAAGEMHTIGAAVELKAKHGAGYYLELSGHKANHAAEGGGGGDEAEPSVAAQANVMPFDHAAITTLVAKHCPSAALRHQTENELVFFLPTGTTLASGGERNAVDIPPSAESSAGDLGGLLEALEVDQPGLGIADYGLRMSTLDDVFVAIAEETGATREAEGVDKETALDHVEQLVRGLHTAPVADEFQAARDGAPPLVATIIRDAGLIFRRRVEGVRYAPSEFLLQVLVPLILIALAFAAAFRGSDGEARSADRPGDIIYCPVLNMNASDVDSSALSHRMTSELTTYLSAAFPGTEVRVPLVTEPKEYVARSYFVDTEFGFATGPKSINGVQATVLISPGVINLYLPMDGGDASTAWSVAATRAYYAAQQALLGHAGTPAALPLVTSQTVVTANGSAAIVAPAAVPASTRTLQLWPTVFLLLFAIFLQTLPMLITLHGEVFRGVLDTMQIHGLTQAGYWLGNFLFDALTSLVFPVGVVIGFAARDIRPYVGGTSWGATLIGYGFATLFYCVTVILYTYAVLSALRRSELGTHIKINLALLMLFLFLPLILMSILRPLASSGIIKMSHPGFPLLESLTPTYAWYVLIDRKRSVEDFDDPAGGTLVLMLLVHVFVPLALLVASQVRRGFTNKFQPSESGIPHEMFADPDVAEELRRVDAECTAHGRPLDAVAANHCWKDYGGGVVAVQGVTFGVHDGEVFGLLGTNGAGKSTTMRLMQLEMDPSGGSVTFGALPHGHSGTVDSVRQRMAVAVCQQHDTLFDALTGVQHLELYLRLRVGLAFSGRREEWAEYIDRTLEAVHLPPHLRAGQYSGGMRRRLATAIALFTGGGVICLDEPSTGLDPFARRLLWRAISASAAPGRSIILTTHSMEEAESVCGRLTIVTGGLMRCLGSPLHLKSRFGLGYTAVLTLSQESDAAVIDEGMRAAFGNDSKPAAIGQLRHYTLGQVRSPATAYRTIAAAAQRWRLAEFAVSQSTLQQVFVSFATGASGRSK